MKKPSHVLIIPSAYPQHAGSAEGSFFREQAIALTKTLPRVGVLALSLRSLRQLAKPSDAVRRSFFSNDEGTLLLRSNGFNWTPRIDHGIYRQWLSIGLPLFERYLERHGRPDLIHAHSAIYAGILAHQIHLRTGIPYVITEHSSMYARRELSEAQLAWAQRVFRHSRRNISVSRSLQRTLEAEFGLPNQWIYIPNIVSAQFFEIEIRNTTCARPTDFLNVALLNGVKRHDLLIDAMNICRLKGRSDFRLTIAGDGPERGSLARKIKALGLERQINMPGMVHRRDMPAFMAGHQAFVFSSDYETFGVAVAEALAVGLPCIVTASGGPNEIVVERDGRVVTLGDAGAVADAMLALTGDDLDATDRAARRARCAARFGEKAVCNSLFAVYCEALNPAEPAR